MYTSLAVLGIAFADGLILFGFGFSGTALFVTANAAIAGGVGIAEIWASALIGALLGDTTSFVVGRYASLVVLSDSDTKIFRTVQRIRPLLTTYGIWLVIAGRFLWVTRKTVPFCCGVARYPVILFLLADGVGCTLWVTVWCAVVYWSYTYGVDAIKLLIG